ncbi:RNA polymerase sigma factor [Flavitalea flava]
MFHFIIVDPINHKNNWARLKAGHRDALLVIYNAFYVGLVNYGVKLTGDRELVKDCITQILLRLWEKRKDLPNVENVRGYLITSLHNELVSQLKARNVRVTRHKDMTRDWPATELPYEELLINSQLDHDRKEQIRKAFVTLTARQLELLQLKYYEDLSYDEIALRCRITKRTAYNIIQKGLVLLKQQLRPPSR